MKSAYELAMERLAEASGPTKSLTDEQKARIAEIEKKYEAQVAQEKLSCEARSAAAATPEELEKCRLELAESLAAFEARRDEEKSAIWDSE
jgi:hypothetical protein